MNRSLLLSLLAVALLSCSKDSSSVVNEPSAQPTVSDFFPMTVGSYWVYEMVEEDSSFIAGSRFGTDSVAAQKDTIIRGFTYTKFVSSFFGVSFFRDSAGYLVNQSGTKYLTVNPDYSVLRQEYAADTDSSFVLIMRMNKADTICVVPAGTFLAKVVNVSVVAVKHSPNWPDVRMIHHAYASSVGIVSRRLVFAFSDHYLRVQLARFHVVPQTPR